MIDQSQVALPVREIALARFGARFRRRLKGGESRQIPVQRRHDALPLRETKRALPANALPNDGFEPISRFRIRAQAQAFQNQGDLRLVQRRGRGASQLVIFHGNARMRRRIAVRLSANTENCAKKSDRRAEGGEGEAKGKAERASLRKRSIGGHGRSAEISRFGSASRYALQSGAHPRLIASSKRILASQQRRCGMVKASGPCAAAPSCRCRCGSGRPRNECAESGRNCGRWPPGDWPPASSGPTPARHW
ncbi:MAG: hypothetical protein BWZ10_01356 [candidate division BRC1 bacterium ADurb.BinA364]|nr:MAG: hypothetical protein BWZ10_01356 [candidate division BRC1 bacterium ADurb.BinA364]